MLKIIQTKLEKVLEFNYQEFTYHMPSNFSDLLLERVQLGKEVRTPGCNENVSFAMVDKPTASSNYSVTPGATNN